ncbi:hypothetical protein [uncultured Chryseobacterium sp.]|uniref:hypothetical protein n=1 Tax=uncultured Chryseobacterium sp. TaxID=259322 RepID=UPI0025F783E2|nr:hypothetical protein [uncultured Chryseobacterium sp.]
MIKNNTEIIFRSFIPLSTATPHAFSFRLLMPMLSSACCGVSVSIGARAVAYI